MPVVIEEIVTPEPSFEPPRAQGEWRPKAPWGQEPPTSGPWAAVQYGGERPANMWAAELDGYVATDAEKDAWRAEALDVSLPDLLPLGRGTIGSPYDGQF